MSALIPLATYNLNLQPFVPVPAIEDDFPVTIRITLASLDPEAVDDKDEPSTLRILKRTNNFLDDLADDEAEEASDEEDELDEDDEEEEEKPSKKLNGKKKSTEEEDDEEEEGDEEDEDEDEDEDDGDDEEFVLCTLSPKTQYQQTIEFTITPSEEVYFIVTGSYPIHLSGNYVQHPADEEDEDDYDEDYDEDEYDLTPDEDEIIYGAPLDDDEIDEDEDDEEEDTPKIEEIVEEEIVTKKRVAEEPASKKSKKAKKNEKKEDKKSVQFSKELEQGPTGSTLVDKKEDKKEAKKEDKKEKTADKKKFPTKTLLGGVITEDRKTGSGPLAKSGSRVGIRYIGKLKNGKVFDKNTTGKPFSFKLGKGECIKGFDLGVTGMAVGGERRVVIPPKMGYGSQALPGIPSNSELTFDIKLVSLK